MKFLFYALWILAAVYCIKDYKNFGKWLVKVITIVPKKIWEFLKAKFKKKV